VARVAVVGQYRFFFYSNEGEDPPHIHVRREDRIAKFWLEPVELAASKRFASHELREIMAIVLQRREEFIEAWNEHFRN
jgi:hypothetical protein